MAYMSIFPGTNEIVEIEEELNPGLQYQSNNVSKSESRRADTAKRSLASTSGTTNCLEDLNQLFEIFNRRASRGSHNQNVASTSKRNASKKPVKAGGSHSPGRGTSERVNLKQALRGLCLSQASEMAAVKVKRSMKPSRSSEPRKVMTMYKNAVVEDSSVSSDHSQNDSGGGMSEISLAPEQTTFDSFQNIPEKLPSPDLWPSNRNSLVGNAAVSSTMLNDPSFVSTYASSETCKPEKLDCGTSSPSVHDDDNIPDIGSTMTSLSSPTHATSMQRTPKISTRQIGTSAVSVDCASQPSQTEKCASQASLSRSSYVKSNTEQSPLLSPHHSDFDVKVLDNGQNSAAFSKVAIKETAETLANVDTKKTGMVVQKGSSTTTIGSPREKKASASTRNTPKPKKKFVADKSSISIHDEDVYSTPDPIVCPRCQCNVTDAWKEADKTSSLSPQESLVSPHESLTYFQDSPTSPFASQSDEVSSGNAISDDLCKSKSIRVEPSCNSKSRNKSEFTQSSKTSPGECSSSTSVSEGSNLTRPSFCDRPHMSKDVRWEAIRQVKRQHGALGLRNFSLLKKLGCGDIGTVYLAELIGTNCLFAIKVMDNEFLSRRKKIARAQTEKEILRMLDHPFLPTLYSQFTSDSLLCLVMEYCPGGDLHVLRQRQPGQCFTEHAARFYVAEVLLALEYLHMLGVVYRDLKPENILVREDGHIMLSDFDLSLRCAVSPALLVSSSVSDSRPRVDSRCAQPLCIQPSTCFTPRLSANSSKPRKTKPDTTPKKRPVIQLVAEPTSARSNSFVGTHEYLSPEIIKGEGHGSAVDWWTLGLFLYELLYGQTPFKGPGNEETLANVILQTLKFPDTPLVSLQAQNLISALLIKEPEDRLGTERGAAEIKQHPFFDGLNWALIRCAIPPEMPESYSYGTSKAASGCGSTEHLEFEVF